MKKHPSKIFNKTKSSKRVIAYVDDFNLCHGKMKQKKSKKETLEQEKKFLWVNLDKLIRKFLPKGSELLNINFYTSQIKSLNDGKSIYLPAEVQRAYWNALEKLGTVKIIEGKFVKRILSMPKYPLTNPIEYVDVLDIQEKRSDVNMAVDMVLDAKENNFDMALIVTNDADFLQAIKQINNLKKDFKILNPHVETCKEFKTEIFKGAVVGISQSQIKDSCFDKQEIDKRTKHIAMLKQLLDSCKSKKR